MISILPENQRSTDSVKDAKMSLPSPYTIGLTIALLANVLSFGASCAKVPVPPDGTADHPFIVKSSFDLPPLKGYMVEIEGTIRPVPKSLDYPSDHENYHALTLGRGKSVYPSTVIYIHEFRTSDNPEILLIAKSETKFEGSDRPQKFIAEVGQLRDKDPNSIGLWNLRLADSK